MKNWYFSSSVVAGMKQRSLHVLSSEMQKAQHRTHKIRGSFFGFVHLRSFSRSARTNKWNVKWLVRQVDIKTKLIFFVCCVYVSIMFLLWCFNKQDDFIPPLDTRLRCAAACFLKNSLDFHGNLRPFVCVFVFARLVSLFTDKNDF